MPAAQVVIPPGNRKMNRTWLRRWSKIHASCAPVYPESLAMSYLPVRILARPEARELRGKVDLERRFHCLTIAHLRRQLDTLGVSSIESCSERRIAVMLTPRRTGEPDRANRGGFRSSGRRHVGPSWGIGLIYNCSVEFRCRMWLPCRDHLCLGSIV